MKKQLVLGLVFVFVIVSTISAAAAGISFDLPKATKAPIIDGKVLSTEWKGAKTITLNVENANKGGWSLNGKTKNSEVSSAVTYTFWDTKGIYGAAKVADTTLAFNKRKAGDLLNGQDGLQIVLDPTNGKSADTKSAYIFDFDPVSGDNDKGPAIWFEHWKYNSMDAKAGVKVKGEIVKGGYNLEYFIPWTALKKAGEKFTPKSGMKMGFGLLLIDYTPTGLNDLLVSFGKGQNKIGNASDFDTVTLK